MFYDFFDNFLPNKEQQQYIILLLASLLRLDNSERLIHFISGIGSNGKTQFINIVKNTFGPYVKTMDSSVLVSEINDPT